jgi:metallophosphoesterase superfamily enzyme
MHRGLALCHRPRRIVGSFVLAGHMYPCVSLRGRSHDGHRLPCYWFSPRMGVLPAFGAVTGMQSIRPAKGERVFASAADRVFELLPRKKPPDPTPKLLGARG